ncbi:MAG: NADH-quinone oxidoreductase subunit C [Candidatus Saganbacteria bacterium]|nr:NADH-quinone oxidoreductase subunit C [Candidatus Saganbacteria bacterium]
MSVIEQIKTRFGGKAAVQERSPRRVYLTVQKQDVTALGEFLFRELGGRFSTASGVDTRPGVEVLYHFAFDRDNLVVSVRTLAEKPELELPSLTPAVPAAEWVEREIHEMFGVNFAGHPNLATLLLPDDWPDGVYPLRKKTFESEQELTAREN